jgi:hypothetical protein
MRIRILLLTLPLLLGLLGLAWVGWSRLYPGRAVEESQTLRAFVHSRPPVPVVFTSRSHPASLEAAADEGEGFTYPGTVNWAATEGRLRLLDTDGRVYELTHGRSLPDGSTLIDVMSPSVSLDGRRILFAGRKGPPDHGHWRIYQVNLDGSGLIPLTGRPDDPGCVALPPLRFAVNGTILSDDDRRRIDYDDVDPIDLGDGAIACSSSRLPDLGRDHARRATQLWVWRAGAAEPQPLSANRNNDRWPFLTSAGLIVYSLWSRNREAVTEDRSDIRPVSAGGSFATKPTDHWMAARLLSNGANFGYAVKAREPVWRPRSLFNGRLAFMTPSPHDPRRSQLVQADWGYILSAPSSAEAGAEWNYQGDAQLTVGPQRDMQGRELSCTCPSPCQGNGVLFAAAPVGTKPVEFGLYLVPDDWNSSSPMPQLLFDDPSFVDAEPAAVYRREVQMVVRPGTEPMENAYSPPQTIPLQGGTEYRGPAGYIENLAVLDAIRSPIPWRKTPRGHRLDPRRDPVIPPPANVRSIVFYQAHRDRFDDPEHPRIAGDWEKVMTVPLARDGALQTWVPSQPLALVVIAGLDEEGKVARWTAKLRDATDKPLRFLAYAGDHYTALRANGYHYCNGCHAGHTHTPADIREIAR